MQNALFTLKAFCPDIFGHARKWFDEKAKENFKIYDVIY